MPTFTKEGITFYYEVRGKGNPAVFLHGGFLDSKVYEPFLKLLEAHYKVYIFDIPPHGKSTPITMLPQEIAAQIDECMHSLQVTNYTVLGHSAGCLVAHYMHATKYYFISPAAGSQLGKFTFMVRLFLINPLQEFWHHPIFTWPILFCFIRNSPRTLFNYSFVSLMFKTLQTPYPPRSSGKTVLIWAQNDTLTPISDAKEIMSTVENAILVTLPQLTHNDIILEPEKFIQAILSH